MFWFYDGLHYPEPMYPFDIIWDEAWFLALSSTTTAFSLFRRLWGSITALSTDTSTLRLCRWPIQEDIPKRVEHFMKRAGYYYQNWKDLEKAWEEKMSGVIKQLVDIEIPTLPEMEDESVVFEGKGISPPATGFSTHTTTDRPGYPLLAVPFRVPEPGVCGVCLLHGFLPEGVPGRAVPSRSPRW